VALPAYNQRASLRAHLGAAPYEVVLDSDSLGLHSAIRLAAEPNGLSLQSTSLWLGNRILASARFGPQGLRPEQATVSSETFTIPASLLGLKYFEDLVGSLAFAWRQNQFSLNAMVTAEPERQINLPPLDLQVRLHGNTE